MKTYLLFIIVIIFALNISAQNYSLQFDGDLDYVEVVDDDILSPTSITIEFWIKQSGVGGGRDQYIYKSIDVNPTIMEYGIGVNSNGSDQGLYCYIGLELLQTNVFPIWNEWNHIAGTFNSSSGLISIFLNGQMVASETRTTSIPNTTGKLNIGWGQGPSYNSFEGLIDEVRISNIVRYSNNFSPEYYFQSDANTLALYHFDEGTGNITDDASNYDNNGTIYGALWSNDVPNPTIVEDENGRVISYELYQNFPNPFNPKTTIKYQIPKLSFVTLKVYNVLGKEIATLVSDEKPAGSYEIEFFANRLTSGIYFYKLQSGSFVETKKMTLMK